MKVQKKDSLKAIGERFYQTRSEKAFAELYHRIRPGLLKYVNGILKNYEESDQLVSQIMSTVWDKIDKYDPKWHISTWIYRIAYTHACMELRYRKASKTTPISKFEESDNKNYLSKIEYASIEDHRDHLVLNEDVESYNKEMTRFRNVLNSLPDEYKIVLVEKFFNDMKYEDISKKLNIPLHTIKNRVARGKKLIKDIYEPSILSIMA